MTMQSPDHRSASFAPRQILMKQGEYGNCAWLIQEGEVDVFTTCDQGIKRIASLPSKHVVGEMALIDHGQRTATVVARTPVIATEIPRNSFEHLFETSEPFARYLLSHLINTIRAHRGLEIAHPFAAGPGIRSCEDPGRILERRVFAPGHMVFREDDEGEAAYLIQSGEVSVLRGSNTVTTLGAGRMFGEMALLRHAKRSASVVVAACGATVEIIRHKEFDLALLAMPRVLRTLCRAYLSYLAEPVLSEEKPEQAA